MPICKPDDWEMDDFSQPWVSDPEEDDLASVALASERSVNGYISPDSLRSPSSSEAGKLIPDVVVSPFLESLMNRYPHHVPRSLPKMRKKRKPLCLFVNFMGTRKDQTSTPPQAGTKRGIRMKPPLYACDDIPLVTLKRQKVCGELNECNDTRPSADVN